MNDNDDLRDEKKKLGLTATIFRRSTTRDTQGRFAEKIRFSGKRLSEIESGKAATRERVEEIAARIHLRTVHFLKTLHLIEHLEEEQRRPPDPLGPTPEQEVALYELERELSARLGSMFRDRIRSLKLEEARRAAERQWKQLEPLAPVRRQAEVGANAAFHTWGLCTWLCARSVRLAADDLKEAFQVARLAVTVAEACTHLPWAGRLLAYALAHLANVYRVKGDHHEADRLFAKANRLWSAPGAAEIDPGVLDSGRIFDLEASLRKDQRRLPEALALLEKILPISRNPGRILVSKAIVLSLMGFYEEAIATLRRADAAFINREPRDAATVNYNMGVNLCHLERFDEAAAFTDAAFEILAASENRLDILRGRWLQARVLAGQGNRSIALGTYKELVEDFIEREMFYDLALISLEIATLLLSLGRTRECRSLVVGLPEYFEAKKIYPEAIAALKVFSDSVRQETATESLARQVVSFLYLARGNQGLRFKPVA